MHRGEEELQDCLENAAEAIHWVGADGTILWANQAELALLGYAANAYVGRNICECYADAPVIERMLHRLTDGETLRNTEARLRHTDGSIRHVLTSEPERAMSRAGSISAVARTGVAPSAR